MPKEENIKSWEVNEKIAALLERFLIPDAQVRHNVFLPVIGSLSKRERQCDVVIEYGQDPRKMLTIVEVQKRNKKPTIGEFQGWLAKKDEVGAHQLICVSELGYPKSVIEYAATRVGPCVKLMTLKEIEDTDHRPLFMLPGLINTTKNYKINDFGFTEVSGITENISIKCDSASKMFSIDDNLEMISLNDIVKTYLDHHSHLFDNKNGIFKQQMFDIDILFTQKNPDSIKPNECDSEVPNYIIVIPTDDHTLIMYYENHHIRVKECFINIRLTIEYQHIDMPFSQFSYRQEFSDGILAWIASARNPMNNHDIQIIFKQDKQGILQLSFSDHPL